jgi:hypothetical protein
MGRVAYGAGPDHVHVDVDRVANQVSVGGHGCPKVTILPERTIAEFSPVGFLSYPFGHQLHAAGNLASPLVVHQQVQVIAGGDIVNIERPKRLRASNSQVLPAATIAFKSEQE